MTSIFKRVTIDKTQVMEKERTMKKKIVALILIVALSFALAATATMDTPVGGADGSAGAHTGAGDTTIVDPENPGDVDLPDEFTELGALNLWFSDLLEHMDVFRAETNYKNRHETTDEEIPVGAVITNRNTERSLLRLSVSIDEFLDSEEEVALKGFRINFKGIGTQVVGGGNDVDVTLGYEDEPGVLDPEVSLERLLIVRNSSRPGAFGGSWEVTMDLANDEVSANEDYKALMTWSVMDVE